MHRWVLASSNAGKLREFQHALDPFLRAHHIELVNQSALGVTGADEPHDTFEENALAKARHASRATGLAAIADDSGICVAALDGAPGVRSARFWEDAWVRGPVAASGRNPAVTTEELHSFERVHRDASADARNLHWLLDRMRAAIRSSSTSGDASSMRDAMFVAAIVLVRHADDPAPIVVRGQWHGRLLTQPEGQQGFGYDPIFFDPTLGRSAGQLSIAEKDRVSHRGQALAALQRALQSALPLQAPARSTSRNA